MNHYYMVTHVYRVLFLENMLILIQPLIIIYYWVDLLLLRSTFHYIVDPFFLSYM